MNTAKQTTQNIHLLQEKWVPDRRTGLIILWALLFAIGLSAALSLTVESRSIYVPLISFPEKPCSERSEIESMIHLIARHSEQQREQLRCDSTLMRVAQNRARDLVTRNYFDHVTPEGVGPNYLVVAAGYPLSSNYSNSTKANSIESLAAGTILQDPAVALSQLLNSGAHRPHILGTSPIFAEQFEIGVGFASHMGSDYRHYWVIIIAEPER